MKPLTFNQLWQKDGSVHKDAPRWAKSLAEIRKAFPSPFKESPDRLLEQVTKGIKKLDELKQEVGGPAFLGRPGSFNPKGPDYKKAREAQLPHHDLGNLDKILEETINHSVDLFKGLPNWNHPLSMPNVIPPANIAAIIAAMMTEVFSPNIIEGEYSWDVEFSELESAAMLARLIGWDPETAGGLFTFGGSGCYFYGMKYALTRVLGRESRFKGIRTEGKILVSQQGHYCKLNSTDWTGLGMDHIIDIETDPETNVMDIIQLERVMEKLYKEGTPIISIICTMMTTDTNAVDPVKQVREMVEKYPNPHGYGKPFIYCDAVCGWSWLVFKDYDFEHNPLEFTREILPFIKQNSEAVQELVYADAVGCDFHKLGWAPYNCSLFVMKDYEEFRRLMCRPGSDYLQERTEYNPGLYTLEVSRSGSYSMAGWATLKLLGYEGFQAILGHILEAEHYLRRRLAEEKDLVCVNPDDYGFVTLFRVYPKDVNADAQYQKELAWPDCLDQLMKHNRLQAKVADKLWEWFREGKKFDLPKDCFDYTPYTSYTSGFRPTEYNPEQSNPNAVIYALKSYPMNVNINYNSMETLIEMVREARDQVVKEGWV
ncbi:MAG: aspartate aminotransferase family protein [Candidatus Aminicenantes bacterium]|nr:aspartate aminotransferase family protein [Candidatus Aminicenantes bacterium]NIM80732.1 aspartate aminotransferase family protein [Candidatus Aminicenantes bacterium]NIN20107.1 aspartate aminotransferase family protein [Candidatus Aminicenantes bacterium]NIN43894.1 aspartate aminotransferase family protein [Candidatus Aminicenantes bacterium]NIN86703.1 aspartate aminotransferase family protein [Candidatus Aminicenantes bacterium]